MYAGNEFASNSCTRCRYEGTGVRPADGPPLFFGPWSKTAASFETIAMATQLGISEHLRAECERVYPDSITVSHGMRAVGGNVCAGEVTLEASSGEQSSRRFDMLVGADGARSVVRGLMQKQVCHWSSAHACCEGAHGIILRTISGKNSQQVAVLLLCAASVSVEVLVWFFLGNMLRHAKRPTVSDFG